jgi:hypothetical protein
VLFKCDAMRRKEKIALCLALCKKTEQSIKIKYKAPLLNFEFSILEDVLAMLVCFASNHCVVGMAILTSCGVGLGMQASGGSALNPKP